jgi:hypothetical protein
MKTQSIDTGVDAEKVQIALIRGKSISEKFSQILFMSQTAIQLSKHAIKRANKDLDATQIDLLFIEYHYGKELSERVENFLNQPTSK